MLKIKILIAFIFFGISAIKAQSPKSEQNDTTSIYTIINDGDNTQFTAISANFKDQDGYDIQGYVGIRDQDDENMASYLSDKKGFAYLLISNNKYIKYLTFDNIGYDRITIPISKLRNKNSIIHIKLKGQNTTN